MKIKKSINYIKADIVRLMTFEAINSYAELVTEQLKSFVRKYLRS